MYIVKNALRCISRSKGRNVLIGIIALVIAVAACIGLSIRQAAESAKASALEGMHITATISFDRSGAMNQMGGGGRPGGMGGMMGGMFSSGDFTIVGYSSDSALTDFLNGNASILDGGVICIFSFLLSICLLLTACGQNASLGLVNAQINDRGELVLIYDNGKEQNLGVVVGR